MIGPEPVDVASAVADAYRRGWALVLAATVRVTRDLDLAEECVQEAYAGALTARPADGVPANPDETGFVKKGVHSAGVQRQYSGTAGRIEDCQVAVFLAYVTPHGRALFDRRLYLPETAWCADADRRDEAGVPAEVGFATKPQLALQMLTAALDADIPARWVTADEVYGNDSKFRTALERRGLGYVFAVSCDHRVHTYSRTRRADDVAKMLPRRPWQNRSAGPGAKGHRDYDWAWIRLGDRRWLLIRRNISTGELAYYRCWAPYPVPLATLVRLAGSRWAIEELFPAGKGQVGLDHYQVRTRKSWHRFITLALLALAFLTIITARHAHYQRRHSPTEP